MGRSETNSGKRGGSNLTKNGSSGIVSKEAEW